MASAWMTSMLDASNRGTLALALALGHEMGIFEVIMASPEPLTSLEIAEKGQLKERYVQEWLGCMVAGEVIQAEKGTPERYFIKEEHKEPLDSIGITARLFASYAVRYDAVKACFKKDGPHGVSHSDFPDVFNVFNVMRKATAVDIVNTMVPLVKGLTEKLDVGIDVVEFGCGTGVLVLEMARRYPNSRFHGSDISTQAISIAQTQLADSDLTNVTFSCDDLLHLPAHLHDRFDWALTFDVIHDLAQPVKALDEISLSLKSGGIFIMADIHTPCDYDLVGDEASMGLFGLSMFLCLPASAGEDGTLGPGPTWTVDEAQTLIDQSLLEFVEMFAKEPYFAYHLCKKRTLEPTS